MNEWNKIYRFDWYRDALLWKIESAGLSLRKVCEKTRIHPSYFSRVMKDKAHFSSDQLFQIARLLDFQEEEIDYLLLLREHESCASRELKDRLEEKIAKLKNEKLKLSERFNAKKVVPHSTLEQAERYYRTTLLSKVHMCLTIPRMAKSPDLVAQKLGLSHPILKKSLLNLEELGLIQIRVDGSVLIKQDFVHLDPDNEISRLNHIEWRLECIERLRQISPRKDNDYCLSVCFSATESTKAFMIEKIKDAIVESKARIDQFSKKAEDVFFISIDLMNI